MTASNNLDTYVPVYDSIPPKWEDGRAFLVERLREITNGVNSRDYAYYIDRETLNGQQYLPGTGTEFRDVFRKVIDVGPLPDFAVTNPKTVAHSITFGANTCITRLYGAASDRTGGTFVLGIPLPHIASTGNIGLTIDATNINITSTGTADYSSYDCAYVVVEWLDEA